jgi:hypothetical protein
MFVRRAVLCLAAAACPVFSQESTSVPADLPDFRWHLTARPWQPVNAPESELLDPMERAITAMAPLQYWNAGDPKDVKNGAIIDPYDKKELQYGTPLFAFNVATLLTKGRAAELAEPAARAMDRCTLNISTGPAVDWHGEFFCAPMVKAIRLLESVKARHPAITDERLRTWKERMKAKREAFMNMKVKQNWRTFAMKGEWLRQQDGYIGDGVKWNEANWLRPEEGGQRERFRRDLDKHGLKPHFFLYHDDTADPETFAYNGAVTANLLDMLESGYDGVSAREMREIIARNLRASLLMLSGSGEAPGGGRTGEHIWDDSIYANTFQLMAEVARREGNERLAGQYRRAVQLLLKSHARFQQENGWFSITKNAFHPSLKNRYASWSGIANYEGFTLACLSETVLATKSAIAEKPLPSEIGGYVATLDPSFASTFLNAGGMQAQLCTRGETDNYGGVQWHVLGITRFSRTGWDGRLGPGAGHVNPDFSDGISFAPVFLEDGKWKRVSLEPKRFQGSFKPEFVHPLLTRGTFTIAPVSGQSGPTFAMHLTLTPDGALVDTECMSGKTEFGVTWPLLEFDGRNVLNKHIGTAIASTAYARNSAKPVVLSTNDAKATDGAFEWSGIDGGDGGPTQIGFRYSVAGDAKATGKARLFVNGTAQPDPVFLSTGSNGSHQLHLPVTLTAGADNVVRLEPNGAVIDELRVHPASQATPEPDQQHFIALKPTHRLDASAPAVRGGYGDFRPVKVTDSEGGAVSTFVYPRSAGDPEAESVRAGFNREGRDFSSPLGRVKGTLYVGRTSAGGVDQAIDLDGDGADDVSFDRECAFILQLKDGKVIRAESDRPVKGRIAGKAVELTAYQPVSLD